MVASDSPCRTGEERAHIEHLVLMWTKGELYPCMGALTRTNEEC
jgi:hypothetical protein